jgi:hypothetical protein
MAIPSRQIGWGTEDNLLWQISKQLEQLTNVTANSCTNCTTTTSTTAAPTYKVFTALLTQSGVSSGPLNIYSGSVGEGISYTLSSVSSASDFSNVGGPAAGFAVDGMYFIATATLEPNNYGGGGLIYDTGAPLATVLENTIGDINFTYNGIGIYGVNSDGLFTENKSFFLGGSTFYSLDNDSTFSSGFNFNTLTTSTILINTVHVSADVKSDDVLYKTSIEIRVYN